MIDNRSPGVIINFTPTGMIPTKEMNPSVPIAPQEIIDEVISARRFGVSMVHLHARGRDGSPTYDRSVYKEIIDGIRERDGLGEDAVIICVSTSGRNWSEFEKRADVLKLEGDSRPDMASLTLGSMNFARQASVNAPDMVIQLASEMRAQGIKPELEAFDLGMVNYAKYLLSKGIVEPPLYFNLLFGNVGTAQATPMQLGAMLSELPEGALWSTAGLGDSQMAMNLMGIAAGGGIRIGLEDNIWLTPRRDKLASNSALLERAARLCQLLEVKVASAAEVRAALGLTLPGGAGSKRSDCVG